MIRPSDSGARSPESYPTTQPKSWFLKGQAPVFRALEALKRVSPAMNERTLGDPGRTQLHAAADFIEKERKFVTIYIFCPT